MNAVKTEKEKARRRFRRLRQLGHLLRYLEAAGFFLFLSYSSTYIPVTARTSGTFFRHAAAFLTSSRFVFLVGNAIVLVLLKSGHFPATDSAGSVIAGEISWVPTPIWGSGDEGKAAGVLERECRRRRSEKLGRRRTVEEVRLPETERECGCEEEGDDEEEFRRTIEEFIAKQQQFRRAESLAVGREEAVP